MTDNNENVFDYDLIGMELEVLGLTDTNEYSYLLSSERPKILSDLHLLFLMRNDRENGERVMEKIKCSEEWA